MDPITILSLIAGVLGGAATILTFYIKRKQDKKEDQDALATVEADELQAGMDRVDRLDAERVQPDQKRPD
jgi:hypothetical protein